MTATPPANGAPTPTPTTLEGRLAAELRAAAQALGNRYDLGGAGDPAHPRPMLLGDALVPGVVGAALDVVRDLEEFATDPPANLRTRARLAEQLAFRASTLAVVVEETAAALEVVAVPADIAAAVDAVCAEVVRLGEHASAFDGVTYDATDEAGEAAGMMAAQVRGEVIGARRALAILLGMAQGAEADGGMAEAYVESWRAAQLEAGTARFKRGSEDATYAESNAGTLGALAILRQALDDHTPGTSWSTMPLFLHNTADLYAPMRPDEAERIHGHAAVVIPVTYAGATPAEARVPDAALDALEVLDDGLELAEGLGMFLESHVWSVEAGEWQAAP